MASASRALTCLCRPSNTALRSSTRCIRGRRNINELRIHHPSRPFSNTRLSSREPPFSDQNVDPTPKSSAKEASDAAAEVSAKFDDASLSPEALEAEQARIAEIFTTADGRTPYVPVERRMQELRDDLAEFGVPQSDLDLAEKPLEPDPIKGDGFFAEGEGLEDPDDDVDFEPNDITSMAHAELEQIRELRQFSRNVIWDMPLLWNHRKEFKAPTAATPLRFRYTTYMGEHHPGARKVVMDFSPLSLPNLTDIQKSKLIKLLGVRYDPKSQRAKMSTDRYPTAPQNKRFLGDMLQKILTEARDGKYTFADVPYDFRHSKERKMHEFPEGWKMDEQKLGTLRLKRREAQRIEDAKVNAGQILDGTKLIAEMATLRVNSPVMAPAPSAGRQGGRAKAAQPVRNRA